MGIPIVKIAEGTVPTQKAVEPLSPMLPAEYSDKTDRTEARCFNPSPTGFAGHLLIEKMPCTKLTVVFTLGL